jgi:hypothetical protein
MRHKASRRNIFSLASAFGCRGPIKRNPIGDREQFARLAEWTAPQKEKWLHSVALSASPAFLARHMHFLIFVVSHHRRRRQSDLGQGSSRIELWSGLCFGLKQSLRVSHGGASDVNVRRHRVPLLKFRSLANRLGEGVSASRLCLAEKESSQLTAQTSSP